MLCPFPECDSPVDENLGALLLRVSRQNLKAPGLVVRREALRRKIRLRRRRPKRECNHLGTKYTIMVIH